MKKFLSLMLVMALVVGSLAGCSKKETASAETAAPEAVANPAKDRANAADTLVVGMGEAKGDFYPTHSSTVNDGYIEKLLFDGLMTNDEQGQWVNLMIEGHEVSADKLTYTFKLKPGIKFSDGTPLTAKDVEFTYTAVSDPSYDGGNDWASRDLLGFDEYFEGKASTVEGIKVIDDLTISFTFKEARADNITNFGFGILPKAVYGFEKGNAKSIKEKFDSGTVVGAGRYKLVKFEPKQFCELEKNENWFGGEIKIPKIICKFTTDDTMMQELTAGNLDLQIGMAPKEDNRVQLEEMGFVNTNAYIANSYSYIGLNLRDPRLADVKVRQALMYGFNRQAFVQNYFNGNGQVCNAPFSKASWAYTDEVNQYEYSIEKANALLDEAGWKLNAEGVREKDGKQLSFIWDTSTDSKYGETLIPMLKADWMKIGVKVEPNLMDFNTLVTKVYTERKFDMYNMSWTQTTDPSQNYYTFHSEFDVVDANNAVGFRNKEVDELLVAGLREFDQTKRAEIYKSFAKKINEQLPYIFLTQGTKWDISNARVLNFNPSPFCDWTHFIEKVELEK